MKIDRRAYNVMIEQRRSDVAVFFDHPAYGKCFRSFSSRELAERFAAGEEVSPQPRKGAPVKITARAKYRGQDERWTERSDGETVLGKPMTVFHFGFDGNALRAKTTCFYRAWPDRIAEVPNGALIAEIAAGATVEFFDDDEVRVDLGSGFVRVWRAEA